MLTSTFLIAIVAYLIFNFTFSAAWNLIVFKKQYENMTGPIQRECLIMPLGMLAMLIEATAMAVMFSMFYTGGIAQALGLSLLVGVFSFVYGALVVPASFRLSQLVNMLHSKLPTDSFSLSVSDLSSASFLLMYDTEYELKFGLLGKIMNTLIMRRKFYQIITNALGDFKKYVEEK